MAGYSGWRLYRGTQLGTRPQLKFLLVRLPLAPGQPHFSSGSLRPQKKQACPLRHERSTHTLRASPSREWACPSHWQAAGTHPYECKVLALWFG